MPMRCDAKTFSMWADAQHDSQLPLEAALFSVSPASQGERIKTCTDYQAVHYSGQAGQRRMDLGGGEALPPDGSSPLRHGGWSWLWRRRRLFGTSVAFRIRAARVVGCITCAI